MRLKKWQIYASIFCIILGTILHFTYDWSSNNIIVGLFSPVNESVWEHLKLLFYPMLLISIIRYFNKEKESYNYWLAQMSGIIISLMFIIIFFYTYTGIIGQNFFLLDIGSFIIGVLIWQYVIDRILKIKKTLKLETLSVLIIIIILILFIIFTVYPPILPLFEDPIYGTFGIEPKKID